jgi:hypothetical protein
MAGQTSTFITMLSFYVLLGAHIYEPGASPCKVFFFLLKT